MKMIAPNIAMPIVAPMALETLKTLERKSVSGMIGSCGAALLPDEGGEQQRRRRCRARRSSASPSAYSVPPQLVSRISAPTPPLSSVAPR